VVSCHGGMEGHEHRCFLAVRVGELPLSCIAGSSGGITAGGLRALPVPFMELDLSRPNAAQSGSKLEG
jgi:hypothetical protein